MARAIDADKLLDDIKAAEEHGGMGAVVAGTLRRYIMRQPTLTPPNEWVSVEDRLPGTAGEFLVVYHPCYGDKVTSEIRVGIDSFRGKTAWAKRKYQRVTHWMPPPEPPKGTEDVAENATTAERCAWHEWIKERFGAVR